MGYNRIMVYCLCGQVIDECLQFYGSPRCRECREDEDRWWEVLYAAKHDRELMRERGHVMFNDG